VRWEVRDPRDERVRVTVYKRGPVPIRRRSTARPPGVRVS
jgi:hypothetical protein